jgi:hypothetical protein
VLDDGVSERVRLWGKEKGGRMRESRQGKDADRSSCIRGWSELRAEYL